MLNSGLFSSKTDDWATPQSFFDEMDKEFHFTLDVCADTLNHKCKRYFTKDGYTFVIITSARNLMQALKNRSDKWRCTSYGKQGRFSKKSTVPSFNKTSSYDRYTASFEFRNREVK